MTGKDKKLAADCLRLAKEAGADAVRISLSRSMQNSISILDGEIDKISFSDDMDINLCIFVEGRYGTYGTNRLEEDELKEFIAKAVEMTGLMTADECNGLPPREFVAHDCDGPDALKLCDPSYFSMDNEYRIKTALSAAECHCSGKGWKLLSCECEWADNLDENYVIDSDGFEGLHAESSFGFNAEVTIEDSEGNKYSGYEWASSPMLKDFVAADVIPSALKKAESRIGPVKATGGITDVVFDRVCVAKLISPILSALDSHSIDQNNSFLAGSLGRTIFSPDFSIIDMATEEGRAGSRLFDTEGLACIKRPIVENGEVKMYFTTSYMARKCGTFPTVDSASRPMLPSHMPQGMAATAENLIKLCKNGFFIYEFNGGNCNCATGDFSFGAEGFIIENGRKGKPVRELVITGNITEFWKNFAWAAADYKNCARWQMPSVMIRSVQVDL